MGSTRRRFTDEYKGHAVRLVLDSGDSIAEIARSIGVHEMTLGKWVKKARDDGEESQRPLDEDERAAGAGEPDPAELDRARFAPDHQRD